MAVAIGLGVAVLGVQGPADAHFSMEGSGAASVATGTLSAPTNTTATASPNSGTVPVSWTGSSLGTGQAAQGYYVLRVRTSDQTTSPACGSGPTALLTSSACSDLTVADGTYRYQVVAVYGSWTTPGALGNAVTVVNDTSLPTITVASTSPAPNANGWVSTSPVMVNLTAAPGSGGIAVASITAWVDGGSATTTLGLIRAVTVSGDGTHVVSSYATDVLGRSSLTATYTVRIDRIDPTAPSAPKVTAATDTGASSADGITQVTAPTVTGTAEAGTTVTVYDGATAVGSVVANGGGYALTTSALAAGSHTLTARATDLADNVSAASAASTVVVDTTAPAAPSTPALLASSDSGRSTTDRITRITTPTFTGTVESGATVTLYDGTVAAGSGTAPSGTWSVATTALSDGAHSVTARATDLAGNLSAASAATSVTIDTLAPNPPARPFLAAASDTGASSADGITRTTAPTFTGTTEKRSVVTLVANATTVATSAAVNNGSWSLTSTTLAHGSHALTAIAADVAGNLSASSAATSVVIDTVAPVTSAPTLTSASDTGVSATDRITRLVTPTLTGTTETGASVVLLDGATQVGSGTAGAGTWTITSTALAPGNRTLTARSTDLAGNVGSASAATTISIDTIAPTVTVNQAIAQADPSTTSPVAFTAIFSETVYGLTGSDVRLTGSAGATTTAIGGAGPTYTLSITGMAGPGLVVASIPAAGVTDAAGNVNLASTSTDNTITYSGAGP